MKEKSPLNVEIYQTSPNSRDISEQASKEPPLIIARSTINTNILFFNLILFQNKIFVIPIVPVLAICQAIILCDFAGRIKKIFYTAVIVILQ